MIRKVQKPKTVERRAVEGVVTVTQGSEPTKRTTIPQGEVQVSEALCNVGMRAGATIPTAEYANIKIEVSLFVPCSPDEVDDTFERIRAWVNERMDETIKEQVG